MHRRQMLKVFAGLALCPLCAPRSFGEEAHAGPHWSYEGATGPDKWGSLDAANAACSTGSQQSPLDLVGPISARQRPLEFRWGKRPKTIGAVMTRSPFGALYSPDAARSASLTSSKMRACRDVGSPGIGQRKFPARSVEKLGLEVRLQLRDLTADGCEWRAQPTRCRRKAAPFNRRYQDRH